MTDANMELSYDVKLHAIEVMKGKRKTSYRVRWVVAGERKGDTFGTVKHANSFLATLTTAAMEGIPFDIKSGLPAPLARKLYSRSWFELACDYVDTKWPHISPTHRRGIAETLTQATFPLLTSERGRPADDQIRKALHGWAFSKVARQGESAIEAQPPADIASTVRWLRSNTVAVSVLEEAETARRVLDSLAVRQDGKAAAPSTIQRRRSTLHGALRYGVELKLFTVNPLDNVNWKAPPNDGAIDRRILANAKTVRLLLAAVREIYPSLEAYFGCMYLAAMRPAEVRHLAQAHIASLPEQGWGELLLVGSTQRAGERWSDSGEAREDRPLKHRAENSTRVVPLCPELVALLRRHIKLFGTGPDGRLFVTRTTGQFGQPDLKEYCNPIHPNTLSRVWGKARKAALSDSQYLSRMVRRPYDLRHAGVSLQLNAGVPATLVAEWAGHSVKILLEVYAGCIDGQDELAKRRIDEALREFNTPPAEAA